MRGPAKALARGPGPVQRARSRETQERVIHAAIELIATEGLARATGPRIAERSGVSWGGIQHQFGDKAAILEAVLQELLGNFEREVERFSTRATSVEGRVRALVAASWDLLRDPTYQAFREVMRNVGRDGDGLEPDKLLQRVAGTLNRLAEGLFRELEPAPDRRELVNVILFATLSGMAEQQRYSVLGAATTERQLKALRRSLVSVVAEGLRRGHRSPRLSARPRTRSGG
jgi:AcrR family transcriptional regulator